MTCKSNIGIEVGTNSTCDDLFESSSKSNYSLPKRSSFLIASEILGIDQDYHGQSSNDVFEEPKQGKYSRRNSLLFPGKISKRDSFIFNAESLDLSGLTSQGRRNSLLFASEFLGLHRDQPETSNNDDFADSIPRKELFDTLPKYEPIKGFTGKMSKRDSFIFAGEAFDLPRLTPSQRRNSLLLAKEILGLKDDSDKGKNKRSAEVSPIQVDYDSIPPQKKRRLSTITTSVNTHFSSNQTPNTWELEQPKSPATTITQNVCGKLISFAQAMKSSERSQIRIHDWDKQMGLRRSHSKTMRNSMRSRKRLLNYCSSELFSSM